MINKFLPLVGMTVIFALIIVWESVQTTKDGYDVAGLQKEIIHMQERNRRLESGINALKKPERIARVVQSIKLELAQPLENRVMIAKAKQQRQLTPEKSKPTRTIVYASARSRLRPLQINTRQRRVKKERSRH